VRNVLKNDEEARRFCAIYDITESGNWENRNIPNRLRPLEDVAKQLNLTTDELMELASRAKPLLYEARRQRVSPGLDDKVITAWNGMMLSAMAEAARVFGHTGYLECAQRTADFLLRSHAKPDGRLLRTSRGDRAHLDAYLEDYAYLAEGLVDLYEAGSSESYLQAAGRLAGYLISDFMDQEQGGFFTTARHHESLILRHRDGMDGATPSANAVAASALARLSFHFDREDWRRAAIAAIRAYGRQLSRYPRAFAKSLAVVDFLTEGPVELAIVGEESHVNVRAFREAVARCYLPNRVVATGFPGQPSSLPLIKDRPAVSGKPTLYICRNYTCRQPITDPRSVEEALQANRSASTNHGPRLLQGASLSGSATVQGTAAYASRVMARDGEAGFANGFTVLGATGLTTTRLGFGTYRVDMQNAEHREALKKALRKSCNLVDTSTNYTDGDSERLVGSVLAELVTSGEIRRDEIIVVSKIGYIQGQNLKLAETKEQSGRPYPELVKYGEGIWHCIHPEFLADQLTLSLDRLGLTALDVCLLHNPEYFLSEATHRGTTDWEKLRADFYARLERAFVYFETQVSAGRLQYYGVSSNTVTSAADSPEATSLARMVQAAEAAAQSVGASTHHFRVLQCPINLFEAGAFRTPNTGQLQNQTVLEYASRSHIAVLVNRPLNAMVTPNRMLRLADLPLEGPPIDVDQRLSKVGDLEQEYRTSLAPHIPSSGTGTAPAEYFNWSSELHRIRRQVQGLEHWEQIEHHMIAPHINQVLQLLSRQLSGGVAEQWEHWRQRYIPELLALLRGFRHEAVLKSRAQTERVAQAIDPFLPTLRRVASLSQKMLWLLTSTPGVTCVLNGMRSPKYVEDSLAILKWEPIVDTRPIYEKAMTLPR
jgi:aryl-alcohol dehydrogenase-like predicted oxidoreductase